MPAFNTITGDMLLMNKEKLRWVWPGRIPYGFISLLAAEGGIGKSGLALWLADKFASEGQKVVYVDAETCGIHITDRIRNWELIHAKDIIFTGKYKPNGDFETCAPGTFSQLVSLLAKESPDIVIMDSLTKLGAEYDLNQMKNVAEFYSLLEELTSTGAAVLIIAHLRKAPPGDSTEINNASIAGSAAIVNLARSVMLMKMDNTNPDKRVLIHSKCNMAKLAPNLSFTISANGIHDFIESNVVRKISAGTKAEKLRNHAMKLIEEGITCKKQITTELKALDAAGIEITRTFTWLKKTHNIIVG